MELTFYLCESVFQWARSVGNGYKYPITFTKTYSANITPFGGDSTTDWGEAIHSSSNLSTLYCKSPYGNNNMLIVVGF